MVGRLLVPCENAPVAPSRALARPVHRPGRVPDVEVAGSTGRRVEHDGPVTVVTIDRPERRNAVDSLCAAQLLRPSRRSTPDEGQSVAVLTGTGGTFCAGADLKAVADGDRRPIPDQGPGPMGPTRLTLSKPVIAAVEGFAVAGGIWSWRSGATFGWPPRTPSSACSAVASGSRCATSERSGFPGSSATGGPWT